MGDLTVSDQIGRPTAEIVADLRVEMLRALPERHRLNIEAAERLEHLERTVQDRNEWNDDLAEKLSQSMLALDELQEFRQAHRATVAHMASEIDLPLEFVKRPTADIVADLRMKSIVKTILSQPGRTALAQTGWSER